MNSASGTLEERTLMSLSPTTTRLTIELVVINRFTRQTRIGEAFVEGDGGADPQRALSRSHRAERAA